MYQKMSGRGESASEVHLVDPVSDEGGGAGIHAGQQHSVVLLHVVDAREVVVVRAAVIARLRLVPTTRYVINV